MNEIIITSQDQWDELPDKFDVLTYLKINTDLIIKKCPQNSFVVARGSSQVVAWDSSHVVARGSSHVEAWESSHVEAWDSSQVVACDSSHVEARGSSHVEAWDSSHVVARGSSQVVAWDSSHVVARGSSHVVACDSSHVEAWDSSHVVACDSSHVEARGSSHVEAWESSHVVARGSSQVVAWDSSHVVAWDYAYLAKKEPTVKIKKGKKATIILPDYPSKISDWAAMKGIPIKNGKIKLWKAVRMDGTDFKTGKISYLKKAIAPDWNPEYEKECGKALHLADSPSGARYFISANDFRLLQVEANVKDCRCFPGNPKYPMKLRARACRFVKEYPKNFFEEF